MANVLQKKYHLLEFFLRHVISFKYSRSVFFFFLLAESKKKSLQLHLFFQNSLYYI